MSDTDKTLAEIAYEAYAKATGGKTFDGEAMLNWFELPANIQIAWRQAAWAVVIENSNREREQAASTGGEN